MARIIFKHQRWHGVGWLPDNDDDLPDGADDLPITHNRPKAVKPTAPNWPSIWPKKVLRMPSEWPSTVRISQIHAILPVAGLCLLPGRISDDGIGLLFQLIIDMAFAFLRKLLKIITSLMLYQLQLKSQVIFRHKSKQNVLFRYGP